MEEEDPTVKHEGLLEKAESFPVVIEIDGSPIHVSVPALNSVSVAALLQILTIANRPRVAGYVIRTLAGALVAAVPAREFIGQMMGATSLKDKAPEKTEHPTLSRWDQIRVRPKEAMSEEKAKRFVVEVVIDGAVEKTPISALNQESMIALLTAATCENLPRISGWNLYDEGGELLASVPAVAFLAELAEKTSLGKAPANAKTAGWRAMPVVAPTSDGFRKLMDTAKEQGRIPQ